MISEEQNELIFDQPLPEPVSSLLEKAAKLQGRSPSDFAIEALRQAAEKAIARHRVIELSIEDQNRVADALVQSEGVPQGLQIAADLHNQLVDPN